MSFLRYPSNPLTLVHLTAIDSDPVTLLEAAHETGFDSIAPRLVSPSPKDRMIPIIGNEPLIRELAWKSREYGVSIPYVDGLWLGEYTKVEDFIPAFETAARLGCSSMLVAGVDDDADRLRENFELSCSLAKNYALSLVVEPLPYSDIKTVGAAASLLNSVSEDNHGLVLDSLHFYRGKSSLSQLEELKPEVIKIFQISDALAENQPIDEAALRHEARLDRLYPGHGDLDLHSLYKTLPKGMSVSVEVPFFKHSCMTVLDRCRFAAVTTRSLLQSWENSLESSGSHLRAAAY